MIRMTLECGDILALVDRPDLDRWSLSRSEGAVVGTERLSLGIALNNKNDFWLRQVPDADLVALSDRKTFTRATDSESHHLAFGSLRQGILVAIFKIAEPHYATRTASHKPLFVRTEDRACDPIV